MQKSGALGTDGEAWEILYAKLLEYPLTAQLRNQLIANRDQIRTIYSKIQGEWWNTGSRRQRFYKLENWFGKACYELRQEGKAIKLVLDDIEAVQIETKVK